MDTAGFTKDVVIIGGCGRVGLPLGLAMASRGMSVTLCDINAAAVDMVNSGRMPFAEEGADRLLAAFDRDHFPLGRSAMLINEGLPQYLVTRLEARFSLSGLCVGILGMAVKGESDDPRESLAYKLRDILLPRAAGVSCADPCIEDERFVPFERVLAEADMLIIAAPHERYRAVPTETAVIDIWGLCGRGVLV